MSQDSKPLKLPCATCGGLATNHELMTAHAVEEPEESGVRSGTDYQICRCAGCESVRFRQRWWGIDTNDENPTVVESEDIYPNPKPPRRRAAPELAAIKNVGRMYRETIATFNAGANVLTGGGLR